MANIVCTENFCRYYRGKSDFKLQDGIKFSALLSLNQHFRGVIIHYLSYCHSYCCQSPILAELCEILLRPVRDLWNAIPPLKWISCTTVLDVARKLAERALKSHLSVSVRKILNSMGPAMDLLRYITEDEFHPGSNRITLLGIITLII